MDLSPDLIDLLVEFESSAVEYLVIGGWAVATHAKPRFTKDLDLWIGTEPANLAKVVEALIRFGAPAGLVEQAASMSDQEFLFFGTPPARIDILRNIQGGVFEQAWQRRARTAWGAITVNLIDLDDLIAVKRAAGRPQDLLDVEQLLVAKKRKR
ncbi:MAG TPA: hypothetical protein VH083_27485 [Myxococcales bacterium]|jgi:hypothetical protein|nr:hypothetical protein [Myxococcales bacterium]